MEAEKYVSTAQIQKLGHRIQEIRERALKNIISKLDHGFVYDNDLARSKEILEKLFEWFLFNQCSHEDIVLKLIKRILQTESGSVLLEHFGSKPITSELKRIKTCVEAKFHPLVDDILEYVKQECRNEIIVPPLQSDVPLSYRSCESSYPLQSSIKIGSTATPIEGFIHRDSSLDQQTGVINNVPTSESSQVTPIDSCLPHYTLWWQPLVTPDRHVLESVEDSLRNPPQPGALLHSCEFFMDIMIHDFPAEVFLQRPGIVSMFQKLIVTSSSSRVSAAVIKCLLKLTKLLDTRIHYYSDPGTHNLKQIATSQIYSGFSSPSSINIAASEKTSQSSDSEDSTLLRTTQMSLPRYCLSTMKCIFDYLYVKPERLRENAIGKKSQIGINAALSLITNLIHLLCVCVRQEMWSLKVQVPEFTDLFNEVLTKFGDIINDLRLETVASDYEKVYRVIHLHLLCSCIHFLNLLVPLDKIDIVVPRNLKNVLSSSVLDLSFSRLYPRVHETLLKLVQEFSGHYEQDSVSKYKLINDICKSMTSTVCLLRKHKLLPILDCIMLVNESLKSLEFHKNLSVIKIFVYVCANKLPMHSFKDDILKIIEDTTLFLLAHSDLDVRLEMYKLCYKKIITAIGPKLNTSKTGGPGSQVLFLMKSKILSEIGLHGMISEHEEIEKCAEDILIHILKCKILVSDNIWNAIVEALNSSLPVLLCYADKDSTLGHTVVSMLDPDRALSLNFATSEVVKGNVLLLFNNDVLMREEGVSRLCWLLSSQDNAREMLPRLNNLHDKALSMVCKIQHLFDVNKLRNTQHFYQPSSLYQVLQLLNSDNIEPVIRRSALSQIAVMMDDPLIHDTFIQNGGIQTITKVMKNALIESNYKDYPDSVIPCVSIIKNVCLYNIGVRQELGENLDIFCYTIRGLFLFCTEDRVKQDASILLFLLLFKNFVTGTPSKGDLAIPKLVAEKLCVPFLCKINSQSPERLAAGKQGIVPMILNDKWNLSSLQIHWNSEWFGGFHELLNWDEIDYSGEDFNEILRLSKTNLHTIKRSSLEYCMNKYMEGIQNATNHQNVIDSINKLTAYINLYEAVKEDFEFDFLSLPWKETFIRFLNVQPSSEDDTDLLINVIRFLNVLLLFYKYTGDCWIINYLKGNKANSLIDVLRVDTSQDTESKTLNQEVLHLISNCISYEQHYLDFHISETSCGTSSWSHVIEIVAECLKFSDTQHFYNLAYLDCLLSCLVHVTATLGWSQSKSAQPPKAILVQLVTGLCEMIGAFHSSKGSTAANSLMGLSITRHAVLILNHLLVEMQHFKVKGWDVCFIKEESGLENAISNLFDLCVNRDVVLRAAIFQLFAGLAVSNRCATELVQELKDREDGFWQVCLRVLLDHEEASIVRENVANLLANLCSHTIVTTNDGCTLDVGVAPTSTKQANSPINSVVKLVEDTNFYKEMVVVLSCLYPSETFYFNESNLNKICEDLQKGVATARNNSLINWEYGVHTNNIKHTVRSLSSKTDSSANGILVITTPSLIKALTTFLFNLLLLAPNKVAMCLLEHDLIKLFFRSLCIPELELRNTKDLSLYCDILEMNAGICSMLNRAVSVNPVCSATLLHTRDCLNVVFTLLNPTIYHTSLSQLVYLRNKLWSEIFTLIGALLNCDSTDGHTSAISVLSSILSDCGHLPFLQSLCEALGSNTSVDLQHSALRSLTSLLKTEVDTDTSDVPSERSRSMQNLLDNTRTPRTPDQKNFQNIYLEKLYYYNRTSKQPNNLIPIETESLMAGAALCKILLHLLDIVSLKHDAHSNKKKVTIINTLTSLLCVSHEAKKFALHNGLMEVIVRQLTEFHLKLSLESVESLRRVSDRKRVNPILKEIGCLLGLVTNFMFGDACVKSAASVFGLADLMHKLWIWFLTQKQLLTDALKLLCTYTTDSVTACQSLPLTSSVAGSGPRKVPSNISLLHAVVTLISKEMDQVSRTHDLTILQLCFHLLQNSCSSTECRIILSKTNILNCLSRLHPAITKRQKPWECIELIWLEFLETFTSHPEGQACVAKISDVLELIIILTASTKLRNRQSAMVVLRNISFYQSNRPRLLTSADFLNTLETKLVSGSLEEKNLAVTIMWSLAANNQKGKLILKCAGLDRKLQETLKILHLSSDFEVNADDIDKMHYVLSLLKYTDKCK